MGTNPLIGLMGQRLIARKDVKSWQGNDCQLYLDKCEPCRKADPSPHCPHRPMTLSDFEAHLAGTHTLGHYVVRPGDNVCKFFAYDLDLVQPGPQEAPMRFDRDGNPTEFNPREAILNPEAPGYRDCVIGLRVLADGLAYRINRMLGISVALEWSGAKGIHVYGFTGEIPAETAQKMAFQILEGFSVFQQYRGKYFWRHVDPSPEAFEQLVTIEVFPKQDAVENGGYGNLMKLPLGIHQGTKERSKFLTTNAPLDAVVEMPATRVFEGDLPWE
jgi:hypothetical protein